MMLLLFPHLTEIIAVMYGDAKNFRSLYFFSYINCHICEMGLQIKSSSIETMEINKRDFGMKSLRFVQK